MGLLNFVVVVNREFPLSRAAKTHKNIIISSKKKTTEKSDKIFPQAPLKYFYHERMKNLYFVCFNFFFGPNLSAPTDMSPSDAGERRRNTTIKGGDDKRIKIRRGGALVES